MLVDHMDDACCQALSSFIKHHQTSSSIVNHSSSIVKHHQALSSVVKCRQALSSIIKYHQAFWCLMTLYGTLWCFNDTLWCFMMLHDASWLVLYHSRWCNDWFIDVLGFWWLTNWLTDGQRLLLSRYCDWKLDVDVGVQLAPRGLYLGLRYSGSGSGGHAESVLYLGLVVGGRGVE